MAQRLGVAAANYKLTIAYIYVPDRPFDQPVQPGGLIKPDIICHADMRNAPAWLTLLLLLAVLVPGIAACVILYEHAFSVPYWDDYHAILDFAAKYQRLPSWSGKILAIAVERHNEYKLGFDHSVVAAQLQLTQHLNFSVLCALGNLALLPIAYLLWLTYQQPEAPLAVRLLTFLPVSLIFFALTYWETLDWAMSGLQNVPVVLFSLLAIYLLTPRNQFAPSRTRLIFACVAAALSAFTSANGFLLAPIGLLILLPRRAYARAALWCASFVGPFAAYLYDRTPMARPVSESHYITRTIFFLGDVAPSPRAAVLLGSLIAALLLWALCSGFYRANPVGCYFALWVVGTACLVAWVRTEMGGSSVSRYSIYSSLLLIFCYAFLTHRLSTRSSAGAGRLLYASALVVAMAFCLAADVHAYHKLGERRSMVLAGIQHYCADPGVNSPLNDSRFIRVAPEQVDYERDTLTKAIQMRIYTLGRNGCSPE